VVLFRGDWAKSHLHPLRVRRRAAHIRPLAAAKDESRIFARPIQHLLAKDD